MEFLLIEESKVLDPLRGHLRNMRNALNKKVSYIILYRRDEGNIMAS